MRREILQYIKWFFHGFNLNRVRHVKKGCIYIFYDELNQPLYVGVSRSLEKKNNRIYQQISNFDSKENIGRIEVIPFRKQLTFKEMNEYEKMFINVLNPKYNEANIKKDIFDPRIILKRSKVDSLNGTDFTLDELKEF